MEWLEFLRNLSNFQLFQISNRPITPLDIGLLIGSLLITWYVGRLTRRLNDHRLFQRVPSGPRLMIIRLIQYAIWVLGILIAVRFLSIDLTGLAVLAGALGVGIGFGLQSIVANFVAGLVLLFERPIEVNDFVTTENVEGRVLDIRFRSTLIRTNDAISIIVPNSEFTNRTVINWSHGGSRVRIHAPVGVAYGSDVEKVTQSLLKAAAATEGVLSDPAPSVWFSEFGDSSLNFELLAWTDQPVLHRVIKSRLNYSINSAFREAEIQIPFPQRDLHLRNSEGLHSLIGSMKIDSAGEPGNDKPQKQEPDAEQTPKAVKPPLRKRS